MSNAISVIPIGYDVMWIGEQLGQDFSGWVARADGVHVSYPNEKFELMTAVIDDYKVAYLAKALPMKLNAISKERDTHILSFTFGGMNIELNTETKANLTGSVVGLDRHPDISYLNWSVGVGVFVQLPRAVVYALADAAFMHIQNCFNHHKALVDICKTARNIDELSAIDTSSGWPS